MTQGYGGTETHDHHVLLLGTKAGVVVRYSRCPVGLSAEEVWDYYCRQVRVTLSSHILFYVVEDLGHIHPKVIYEGKTFDNGLGAHMP